MPGTSFFEQIDAAIVLQKEAISSLRLAIAECEAKIAKLEAVRADTDLKALLESAAPPASRLPSIDQVAPKSRQLAYMLSFFKRNGNAWSTASDIAAGTGLPSHTVRQMAYSRYKTELEKKKVDRVTKFRLKDGIAAE
jgi:cysteine sulfinate desulfinase/cysteine desulfurase-like protein